MKRRTLLRALGWLPCAAAVPSLAYAAICALTPTVQGGLHVVDVNTLDSSVAQAVDCCAVETGTVSALSANDLVYFIANSNGVAQLYAFDYGVSGTVTSIGISASNSYP